MSMKSRLPSRSRDGYISQGEHQLSVRVDPIQIDIDDEIYGLGTKVDRLKHVAREIEKETKSQNEIITQLENTLLKGQAALKGTMKRLNRSIVQNGSNHLMHVLVFVFLCVVFIVLWSKFFRSR